MDINKNKIAFTLIELLIVVAIIGILAAIAVPNFLNAQMRARVARVEGEFKAISTAFEMYRLDNGDLPRWGGVGWAHAWSRFTTPIAYMSIRAVDPFESKHKDLWQADHQWYEYNACRGKTPMKNLEDGQVTDNYVIVSYGPNGIDDTVQISDYPNSARFLSYNSTNGLTSDGDIARESSAGLNPQRW